MSQHRSLRAAATLGGKRNVLKRFERLEMLKKRGQWKAGDVLLLDTLGELASVYSLATVGFALNLPFEKNKLDFLNRWLEPVLRGAPEILAIDGVVSVEPQHVGDQRLQGTSQSFEPLAWCNGPQLGDQRRLLDARRARTRRVRGGERHEVVHDDRGRHQREPGRRPLLQEARIRARRPLARPHWRRKNRDSLAQTTARNRWLAKGR